MTAPQNVVDMHLETLQCQEIATSLCCLHYTLLLHLFEPFTPCCSAHRARLLT